MREEGRVCESRMRLGEFQKEQLPFWGHRLEPREYSGSRPPPPCAASEALSFLPPLWTFCCCYCYHSSSLSLLLLYPPTPPKKQANTGKSCPIQRKMREHFSTSGRNRNTFLSGQTRFRGDGVRWLHLRSSASTANLSHPRLRDRSTAGLRPTPGICEQKSGTSGHSRLTSGLQDTGYGGYPVPASLQGKFQGKDHGAPSWAGAGGAQGSLR